LNCELSSYGVVGREAALLLYGIITKGFEKELSRSNRWKLTSRLESEIFEKKSKKKSEKKSKKNPRKN
jgi:hypothetical protein